jgi:hypothetical protein
VLGEALLDLPRLLVRVDVERQVVLLRVSADLVEPVGRARANGVRGEPDAGAGVAKRLDLPEVVRGGLLAEPWQAAAAVSAEQEDELDPSSR